MTEPSAPFDDPLDLAPANAEARIRDELLEVEHTPKAPPLLMSLCLCLAAQGREADAYVACEHASLQAKEHGDTDLAIRALLQMLRLAASEDMFDGLLDRAEQYLSAEATPVAAVDVAAAFSEFGRGARAMEVLEELVRNPPDPAPRSVEMAGERRALAVAAFRLAEMRAAISDTDNTVDELLMDAVDANDSSVTPVAALWLAQRREKRDGQGCAGDEMYRTAWRYDHPQVWTVAGHKLAGLYESRGQIDWALDVLHDLALRGDGDTVQWATANIERLRRKHVEPSSASVDRSPWSASRDVSGVVSRRLDTLIIGAGSGAQRLLLEVNHTRVHIIGLVDDRVRGRLEGFPVLGRVDELPSILARHRPDQVLLAIPTAAPDLRLDVALCCAAARVWLRVLPNPFNLLADRDYVRQLRSPRVEETYGEMPIAVDPGAGAGVRGRSVLIVGAGGTIGAELARQVVVARPRDLTLLDRNEASLVKLELQLKDERRFRWVFPVVADTTHRDELRAVIRAHQPDVVFIATGINHAHMAEKNIVHAARVNVLGPWITTEEAIAQGAGRVILVSGDNAARRRGVLDYTKALAERAVMCIDGGETCVAAIRIRSVSASPGSVFERFDAQVRCGGPLTLTAEDAERRFTTLHEAAQWILRVGAIAEHGGIYAIDDGVPIRIRELAERVIRMHGLEPEVDIRILVNGPRSLEKMSDVLWSAAHEYPSRTTSYPEVTSAQCDQWRIEELAGRLREIEAEPDIPPEQMAQFLRTMLDTQTTRISPTPASYADGCDIDTYT